MKNIILASNSPRRRELLAQAGIQFNIETADIDENIDIKDPAELVRTLSRLKAAPISEKHPDSIVIGADTIVVCDEKILGKPIDETDAFSTLKMLSGREHFVYTGVSMICKATDTCISFAERTAVEMFDNDDEQIRSYIASGEPMDKAGSYGIQGLGAILVKGIHGDYNNVVGLPLARVFRELNALA